MVRNIVTSPTPASPAARAAKYQAWLEHVRKGGLHGNTTPRPAQPATTVR